MDIKKTLEDLRARKQPLISLGTPGRDGSLTPSLSLTLLFSTAFPALTPLLLPFACCVAAAQDVLLCPDVGLAKVKVKVTQSCPTLCDSVDYISPWNSLGQNTGVGSLSLLQGIFPTQGSTLGFPHCRQILYQLSHKRSPNVGLAKRVRNQPHTRTIFF